MSIPELELVSHDLCPYVQRAVITLLEKDISHQRSYIGLSNKPDWFHQISLVCKMFHESEYYDEEELLNAPVYLVLDKFYGQILVICIFICSG